MAEGIKLNFLHPVADKELWQMAKAFQCKPDTVCVFAHGSSVRLADYSSGSATPVFLSPLELGLRIDAAGASRESEIVLISCGTAEGMSSFSRELSQYYELVVGATRQVRTLASNEDELLATAIVSGADRSGRVNPNDQGKWKYYFGQDYRYCNAHPEECDPPESERPPPTHTYKVLGATVSIKETDTVYPVTRFKPGQESEPVSPDKEAKRREVMYKLFSNIVDMELGGERGRGEFSRVGAIHHYPELADAFKAFDNIVLQSKRQSGLEPKEYLGDRLAEIYFVIKNGYPIERGIKTYVRITPIVESESEAQQAYSR